MKSTRRHLTRALFSVGITLSFLLAGCGPAETPSPPTATLSPAQATQTAVAGPHVTSFAACLSTCSGSNAQTTFPAKTKTIFITWKYENFPAGAHYVRTWTHENYGVWKTYDCRWDRPKDGQISIKFFDVSGLAAGVWTLKMTVDNQLVLDQKLTIEGTETYWAPMSPISSCFGG